MLPTIDWTFFTHLGRRFKAEVLDSAQDLTDLFNAGPSAYLLAQQHDQGQWKYIGLRVTLIVDDQENVQAEKWDVMEWAGQTSAQHQALVEKLAEEALEIYEHLT